MKAADFVTAAFIRMCISVFQTEYNDAHVFRTLLMDSTTNDLFSLSNVSLKTQHDHIVKRLLEDETYAHIFATPTQIRFSTGHTKEWYRSM